RSCCHDASLCSAPLATCRTPHPYTTLFRSHLTPAHHQGDLSDVADVGERIGVQHHQVRRGSSDDGAGAVEPEGASRGRGRRDEQDRKSTRLNSSHGSSSYAVFCLKKKNHTR